jgi:DNA-binding response OmpR family regulator
MCEAQTNEWRQTCLQVLTELEPGRRVAALEKLRRILRKKNPNFGSLRVDFGHAEVKRNGNPVSLTNLEFRLLRYLTERAGCVVSREDLLRSVWGYSPKAFTRTVDVHIHSLRQKLGENAAQPQLIVTVTGAGYKLVSGPYMEVRR